MTKWCKGFPLRRKLVKLWRCLPKPHRPFRYHRLIHNSPSGEAERTSNNKRKQSIPKGHLAVYVGGVKDADHHRFFLPVLYVNHPFFSRWLADAEQEYGFRHTGGITIPCGLSDFENVKKKIAEDSNLKGTHYIKGTFFQRLMHRHSHCL